MGNRVGRFEIAASDLALIKDFYAELFGWEPASERPKRFALMRTGDGIDGLFFQAEAGLPTFVTFCVEVDDLDEHLRRAETLGGTTYVPPTPSPVAGEARFAAFGDPEGNIVGLVERTP